MALLPFRKRLQVSGLAYSLPSVAHPVSAVAYTCTGWGQVAGVDSPGPDASGISHYGYDASGNLIIVTNALSEPLTFTFGARGIRTSAQSKSATGTLVPQQQSTYDELAPLITHIGASGQTVHYAYTLRRPAHSADRCPQLPHPPCLRCPGPSHASRRTTRWPELPPLRKIT